MLFPFVQILYWIALSTWFGGVIFIAMSAPVIFRTVREANPIMPSVLSVNLEGQHGSLLAGTIVGNLITALVRVELVCAGALFIALIAQWFFVDLSGPALAMPLLRTGLYLGAVMLVIYDWRVLWPRILKYRTEYLDHADEPDIANPAKEQFDHYHKESVNLLIGVSAMLLGMILFSGNIQSASSHLTFTRSPGNAEATK